MMSVKTRKLVYGAMFVAIAVLLDSYLSFYLTENSKVTLAPAVVMLAGGILGPWWGMATGAITNVLSFLLSGRAIGAYFPGFTLTMALYGLFAALFFYQKQNSVPKIIGSTILIQTACSLLINTAWNAVIYGTPFGVLLAARAPVTYISCALYIGILCLFLKLKDRIFRGVIPQTPQKNL